ncbi:MAG: hypothetical protein ABFC12_02950 [Methanobacterium sp.]
MDNKVKIVIVVAVILVAVLGITSGSSIQKYFTSNLASEGNNTTNTSVNQTNNTTTTPRNTNYIGTETAIEIGKTVIGDDPHIKYYAELNAAADVPYYLVGGKIYNERGEEISQTSTVKVDAATGEIL